MHRSQRVVIVVVLASSSFLLGSPDFVNATDIKITGTYSDMCYNQEGGDILGMEITIVGSREGHFSVFQASEGEPSIPVVVRVIVKDQEVEMTIPESTIFSGTFKGKVTSNGLRGSIEGYSGYASKLFLKRQASYWQRESKDRVCK
jgi:hypothetical protein